MEESICTYNVLTSTFAKEFFFHFFKRSDLMYGESTKKFSFNYLLNAGRGSYSGATATCGVKSIASSPSASSIGIVGISTTQNFSIYSTIKHENHTCCDDLFSSSTYSSLNKRWWSDVFSKESLQSIGLHINSILTRYRRYYRYYSTNHSPPQPLSLD